MTRVEQMEKIQKEYEKIVNSCLEIAQEIS
jgi:hypothetical protein